MDAPSISVLVVGAAGRMGRFACELASRTPGLRLAGAIGRQDDLRGALCSSGASVALDVTRAGLGYRHGALMLECGVRPVIGTSGVSEQEVRDLDAQARELGLGGLVVPNFSLGMLCLQRAAVAAARHFERFEILELHHEKKRDAPSATAVDTARKIERARAAPDAGGIPIHSVRLPGLYAHQVVMCGAQGELFSLRHDMLGPEAFGPGLLIALTHAARAIGVGSGLGVAIDAAEA